MTENADIAAVVLRSDRFRIEREADWTRLEAIVARMEKGGSQRLSDEDVLELPTLYRTLLSSLSIARESSLDAGLVAYLESLSLRAYFLVYGTRTSFGRWCARFFGGGWSRAIQSIGTDIAIALFVMVAGTLVGYFMVAQNADFFYALVPDAMSGGRVPGASEEVLRQTIFGGQEKDGLAVFATYLFSNNAQVSILCFALGFAFGVPTVLLLIHNMAVLGAMFWVFAQRGLGLDFLAWLSIHGTTEIFAILLSGAAGIHVGRTIAFPRQATHLAAAKMAGTRAAQVMVGVVVMLVIAGLLEGFARQLIGSTPARFAIGGSMLIFWLAYFFAPRRKPV